MPMTLRLTPEETDALRDVSRLEHRSIHSIARGAMASYVTRRARRRDDYLATIVAEDAELLRCLPDMWRITSFSASCCQQRRRLSGVRRRAATSVCCNWP